MDPNMSDGDWCWGYGTRGDGSTTVSIYSQDTGMGAVTVSISLYHGPAKLG